MYTNKILLSEFYWAIEGEGLWQGKLCYFIRFAGCNLNCSYCDEKDKMICVEDEIDNIILKIENNFGNMDNTNKRIVITGGEPFKQEAQLINLLVELLDRKKYEICIYTNGTYCIPEALLKHKRIRFVVDYKLNDVGKMKETNLINLDKGDVLKFVVEDVKKLNDIKRIAYQYPNTNIILSPAWDLINPKDISNWMIANKVNDMKLGLQQHKYIYPEQMKGV